MRLNQQTLVLISLGLGILLIIGLVAFVAVTSTQVQNSYSDFLAPAPPPQQQGERSDQLVIRKIRVTNEGECGSVVLERNGTSTLVDCDDTTKLNSVLLSNERIAKIFENLTSDEFINLEDVYYAPGLKNSITITLETNFGTKTITISNSDSSATSLNENDVLEEIVDEIEDTENELEEPPAPPPPSVPPTPTPTPGSGIPTPTPSGSPSPSSTPTPTLEPGATVEPFNCGMLENQGVTVSNIRCLDQ